jgi:hypothetical protein
MGVGDISQLKVADLKLKTDMPMDETSSTKPLKSPFIQKPYHLSQTRIKNTQG